MSNSESLSSFGRTGSDGLSIEEPPAGAVYEDLTDDELVELALAADLIVASAATDPGCPGGAVDTVGTH